MHSFPNVFGCNMFQTDVFYRRFNCSLSNHSCTLLFSGSSEMTEKDKILQEKEAELRRMQEMLTQMQQKIKEEEQRNATPSPTNQSPKIAHK